MKKLILLGAGKIGQTIANFLHHSKDYAITVCDVSEKSLNELTAKLAIKTKVLDITAEDQLLATLQGQDIVVSALPYYFNQKVASAALRAQTVSYFDLTEDVETTKSIRKIANEANNRQIFMPQCGLAPGFIGVLGYKLSQYFDEIHSVKMRVGALPLYPNNMLKYNLTWSTDGLINEYCNVCEAIHDGKRVELLPLEGLEEFSTNGVIYEAFNTSGGLGTLCETLYGKVREMNYKSIRHQGHSYLMKFLINDLHLKFGERRALLKQILESAIPISKQDVVLVYASANGIKDGKLEQIVDTRKIYHRTINQEHFGSIQITTAAAICTAIDLHVLGKLPPKGFVRQEDISSKDFLENRFGKLYDHRDCLNCADITK